MSRRQAGNAAAEFALVAGVLALLIVASFDLAIAVTARAAVGAAAREGVRQAAVDGGDTPAVRQRIADALELSGVTAADITVAPKQAGYGRPIRVRVTVHYEPRTPVLRGLAGGPIVLASEAVARNERVP